ncbi:hypothetical protein [Leptolyngbya sp. FACHB-711]|uniref:hypothetical protein n=1 Tax=unclassified Leptolyngbya TaxID=2650499 RepID=UPI001688AA72|nr:hypothetical protein [Leptolyngbya sp. FACHB-711]MBD1849109.1 hypothetical protein [Cyanobacteria bacterium FACHB-502]MBD2028143.1 hypothetical protein [Leptolyngbya sp. FACHB-711]
MLIGVVTSQPKSCSASLLAFLSASSRFVSQAGYTPELNKQIHLHLKQTIHGALMNEKRSLSIIQEVFATQLIKVLDI